MNWIYNTISKYLFPNNNPGVKVHDENKLEEPAISIDQIIAPIRDREGAFNVRTQRVGGGSGSNCFFSYHIDEEHYSGHDIGLTSLAVSNKQRGGQVFAQWLVAAGSSEPESGGGVVGTEINIFNRRRDEGLKHTRSEGKFSVGMQLVPENSLNVGKGIEHGYNVSFGISFSHSCKAREGKPWHRARTHVPILIEPGAIADGGYGFLVHGSETGSQEPDLPARVFKGMSHFKRGLDFTEAEFVDQNIAVELQPKHRVSWGASYISGIVDVPNGLMLGTDHLYWNGRTRSLYRSGNALWYRWQENGVWHYQHVAGPK